MPVPKVHVTVVKARYIRWVIRVRLKAGHVQPVALGHSWVFAQAIENTEGTPAPGELVHLHDPRGRFVGKGFWSPNSAIPVRVLSRVQDEEIDAAFFRHRVVRAMAYRRDLLGLPSNETTGYRAINSEGDGLPGLTVDVYGKVAVAQITSLGLKQHEEQLFHLVKELFHLESVYEVSSEAVQKREGFKVENRLVLGEAVDALRFRENGFDYELATELLQQKTGFYFDQRENRALVGSLAKGRSMLDMYSYVGAFSLAGARAGAENVTAVDSSASAIAMGAMIARQNGLADKISFVKADARQELQRLAKEKHKYGLVVLDPPKLLPNSRSQKQAQGLYRHLNQLALRLVEPGGLLLTCSCSSLLNMSMLERILTWAAYDAQRDVQLISKHGQAPCHPTPIALPESRYLTCILARVI